MSICLLQTTYSLISRIL